MDYILNGQAHGSVASLLMASGFNTNIMRPFIGKDGRSYYIDNGADGKPVAIPTQNAATLRKDDWLIIDRAAIAAAKPRLRLVGDLVGSGLTYNIPNGMGTTVLQTERVSDISAATISLDGLRQSNEDRPVFDLVNLPLPIIHKDFTYSARQIAASRKGGSPLDTTTLELASRKVAEQAEALALGITGSWSYAGGTIYGLSNFPNRLTKVLTSPEATGWTPKTLVTQILAMKAQSVAAFHYGPWKVYVSPDWDPFLDEDYSDEKGDNTLRERLAKIDGLSSPVTLDYLTGYQIFLVQQTSDVIREVIGMPLTTLQWETHGGMMLHFKVMTIMVPQLRADMNNNTGIVHGTAPS